MLYFISSLDFKPLFVPIEAHSGSVYMMHTFKFDEYIYTEISFSLLASLRSCLLSMYFFKRTFDEVLKGSFSFENE